MIPAVHSAGPPLPRITGTATPPTEAQRPLYRVAAAEFRRAMRVTTAGMALRAASNAVQAEGVDEAEALQIVADAVSYAATHHAAWFWGAQRAQDGRKR